jgi:hypothetical protein
VSQDNPPTTDSGDLALSEREEHALQLAHDLRDRVRRERAAIRRLRAYLDRTVDPLEG